VPHLQSKAHLAMPLCREHLSVIREQFWPVGWLDTTRDKNAKGIVETLRTGVWDRVTKETATPGIYYDDFPELSGFTCPEWSHLFAGDSVEFSKRHAPLAHCIADVTGPYFRIFWRC
jgi:hypothetical protein